MCRLMFSWEVANVLLPLHCRFPSFGMNSSYCVLCLPWSWLHVEKLNSFTFLGSSILTDLTTDAYEARSFFLTNSNLSIRTFIEGAFTPGGGCPSGLKGVMTYLLSLLNKLLMIEWVQINDRVPWRWQDWLLITDQIWYRRPAIQVGYCCWLWWFFSFFLIVLTFLCLF